jgi:hypothetical protein
MINVVKDKMCFIKRKDKLVVWVLRFLFVLFLIGNWMSGLAAALWSKRLRLHKIKALEDCELLIGSVFCILYNSQMKK